jgi:hypothetical protein
MSPDLERLAKTEERREAEEEAVGKEDWNRTGTWNLRMIRLRKGSV